MVRIASCESSFTQYGEDGLVFRGRENPLDVGTFMINEYWHLEASLRLGYDIHTFEGNLGYAKYLFDTAGTTPWNWSRVQEEGVRGWLYGECS